MGKKRYILPIAVVIMFTLCTAGLINVLIEREQGKTTGLHPADAIILFAALCGLLAVFLVARGLSGGTFFGFTIPERMRSMLTVGLMLLIPQSTILYGRVAQAVHSEITLFAVCNIIDIAVGRMLFAMMHKNTPLLPPPEEGKNESMKRESRPEERLDRTTIKNMLDQGTTFIRFPRKTDIL